MVVIDLCHGIQYKVRMRQNIGGGDETSWLEAGLENAEASGLARAIRSTEWRRPALIELDGEQLLYSAASDSEPIRSERSLLDGFLDLAESSPEAILKYARQFGVLELCEHDLPRAHNPPTAYEGAGIAVQCLSRNWAGPMDYWEPLEIWRLFAKQMRAILNVAANIYQQKPGRLEDWTVIYSVPCKPEKIELLLHWHERQAPLWLEFEKHRLAKAWNWLLHLGNVRPCLSWTSEVVAWEFGGKGLFGNLAIQLVLAASRTEGLAKCSTCPNTYIPKYRPAYNRSNYCPNCREKGMPQRKASRTYYHKHPNKKGRRKTTKD